jgi:excinuclease ABC subunit C
VLPRHLQFAPERDTEVLAAVPDAAAVFLLRGDDGEPYVSKSANLRRRLTRLLSPPAANSKRLNLRERVRAIEYMLTGSDFESGLLLYHTLRREFPKTYEKRLRLRPAPLVRLILENRYPRATVTTRMTTLRGRSLYYGPFATRAAAEKFANDSLDFFQIRRCTDDLNPDPAFPGCIYSEMKMCLAPCFRGCTDAAYAAEVARVQQWFDTGGQSLVRELSAERDRASAGLEFERAAELHARLEKVAPVAAQVDEIVRRIDRLNGVIVQPSAEPEQVSLFRIEAGRLNGPIPFAVNPVVGKGGGLSQTVAESAPENAAPSADAASSEERKDEHHRALPGKSGSISQPPSRPLSRPLSMEARIVETLDAAPLLPPGSAQETIEQLAYLKRWYYRSSKIGEAFFTDEKGELPMRRLVRGIARVFRGERPAGDLSETTRDYWVNRGRAAQLNPEDYNV